MPQALKSTNWVFVNKRPTSSDETDKRPPPPSTKDNQRPSSFSSSADRSSRRNNSRDGRTSSTPDGISEHIVLQSSSSSNKGSNNDLGSTNSSMHSATNGLNSAESANSGSSDHKSPSRCSFRSLLKGKRLELSLRPTTPESSIDGRATFSINVPSPSTTNAFILPQLQRVKERIDKMDTLEEVDEFLRQNSVKTLIDSIPSSLPLLERIYRRFAAAGQGSEFPFPVSLLKPEYLFTQLVWWIACYLEDKLQLASAVGDRTLASRPTGNRSDTDSVFKYRTMQPTVRSLIELLQRHCPVVISNAKRERERIEMALEGLGLHGLVNCSGNQLIKIGDAAKVELHTHQARLKAINQQLERVTPPNRKTENKLVYSINGCGGTPVLSRASHQRQMNLKVSEICDRLHQNENIYELVRGAVENKELQQLIRILHKRIQNDRGILNQLEGVKSLAGPSFSVLSNDPIVSKVLVQFKNAYDELLLFVDENKEQTSQKLPLALSDPANCGETTDSDPTEDGFPPPPTPLQTSYSLTLPTSPIDIDDGTLNGKEIAVADRHRRGQKSSPVIDSGLELEEEGDDSDEGISRSASSNECKDQLTRVPPKSPRLLGAVASQLQRNKRIAPAPPERRTNGHSNDTGQPLSVSVTPADERAYSTSRQTTNVRRRSSRSQPDLSKLSEGEEENETTTTDSSTGKFPEMSRPSRLNRYSQELIYRRPEKNEEIAVLRSEIERLQTELVMANQHIHQLSSDGYYPKPDYPHAGDYYKTADVELDENSLSSSSSSKQRNNVAVLLSPTTSSRGGHSVKHNVGGFMADVISASATCSPSNGLSVVQRYSNLFSEERAEIMRQLNQLPDFQGLDELQLKVIFSVIVLAFRSVQESVEQKRGRVWALLEGSSNGNPSSSNHDRTTTVSVVGSVEEQLDSALFRFMYTQAKTEHGMANAKEVTAQIWRALYDFPSLKTCTRFNRFVLDAVAVVWDLVAGGVDATAPRYHLEYETVDGEFSPEKHLRFQGSSLRANRLKRYVWPALIEVRSGKIVQKGIVIT